jgi:monovalent cation:H+ antiporter, CPA1 family
MNMHYFELFSILITLAAVFSYINVRSLKLPSGISLMLMGTCAAFGVILAGYFSPEFSAKVKEELSFINFPEFLLEMLLSFLLFAGSLHVDLDKLRKSGRSIASFATLGTLLSTFLVAGGVYLLFGRFHLSVPLLDCLMFGALISPTDPIAVMGILKKARLSDQVETNIIGESLFNDGIGVVIFATLLQIAIEGPGSMSAGDIAILFLREAGGGLLAGLVIGYVGYRLMKTIDHFQTEALITLAMVMGGYTLCHSMHVSGPLAMVVAGLMTGNKGRSHAMSEVTRVYLEKFWEVTDEILNAILFLLIGLEVAVVNFQVSYLTLGILSALLIVLSRFISLWLPSSILGFRKDLEDRTLTIMTWGGLRGGISIALALSLPAGPWKDLWVSVTFIVVLFSILVQGFTIGPLIRRLLKK